MKKNVREDSTWISLKGISKTDHKLHCILLVVVPLTKYKTDFFQPNTGCDHLSVKGLKSNYFIRLHSQTNTPGLHLEVKAWVITWRSPTCGILSWTTSSATPAFPASAS